MNQYKLNIRNIEAFKNINPISIKKIEEKAKIIEYKIGEPICENIIPQNVLLILQGKSRLLYKDKLEAEEEFGDILFSLINYSRHIGIDSNESLKKSTEKFIKRFKRVEKQLKISGNFDFSNYSEEELNLIWEQAKKE